MNNLPSLLQEYAVLKMYGSSLIEQADSLVRNTKELIASKRMTVQELGRRTDTIGVLTNELNDIAARIERMRAELNAGEAVPSDVKPHGLI